MYSYALSIGRNVGATPMSTDDWQDFIGEAREILATHTNAPVTVLRGRGNWQDMTEDTARLEALTEHQMTERETFQFLIEQLAVFYHQDAIAFTFGVSRLIAPILVH